MADPALTGARVLAALSAGRQRAIAAKRLQAASIARAVLGELNKDIIAGHPVRGRAGRITRRLGRHGVFLTERHVLRILDRLSSVSDSSAYDHTIASE
jgi:hypothetical protein